MTTTDSIWAAAEHLLRRDAAVPLQITAPNFEGETQCLVRWQVETPAGWVGAWNRAALEYLLGNIPAQAAPAAVAGPVVAWRVVVRGVNSSAQRHWIDGAPSDEMLADFALNAPQASIQYAYAAPTTQAAPAAQWDALDSDRLNWLEANAQITIERLRRIGSEKRVYEVASNDDEIYGEGDTLRAAIDVARVAKEGGA